MSLTPEQTKKFNLAFGTVFLVGAMVTWGMAIYFGVAPAAPKPIVPTNATVIRAESCKSTLEQMGFTTRIESNSMLASKAFSISDESTVESDINLMTAASLACKYPVTYMCIGTECKDGAMTIRLGIPNGALK